MTDDTLPPDRFAKLAAWHFRVIPVHARDKKPAVNWGKYMTEAPSFGEIARWDGTDFNVGIVTGLPDGVVVLDVDNDEAQQFVDGLGLPLTPTVRTGRGHHYYFKTPAREIRNTVRLADQKLDIRGRSGFVVAPGSIHASGSPYEWEISPAEVDFAPFPEQILALIDAQLKAKPKRTVSGITSAAVETDDADASQASSGIDKFLQLELDEAISNLSASTKGERNMVLFKMAVRLARHVAAAKSGWEPFATALAASARSIGLEEDEIVRTIESGWTRGSAEPTPWLRVAVEHVYLSAQATFYHLESGKDLKREGFDGQHGHNFQGKGAFSAFLLKQGIIRKVYDLSYEPRDPRRYIERNGLEYLNTYRPSGVIAIAGNATPFERFLEGLVPETAERAHLLKMMAFTILNPGEKLRHALLLRTEMQGVGKSMLMDIWSALVGTHNVKKPTSEEIASGYQGYLTEALLIVCEELNLGMGPKLYNMLKEMITGDTVRVNEKYMKQREWPVHGTFVLLTNLARPLMIEETDRRIFVIDSKAVKQPPEYYREFTEWWKSNLGVVLSYLKNVNLQDFNPYEAPPMTAAKRALIAGSKTAVAQDLQFAIEQGEGVFERDLVTLAQVAFHFGRKWSEREISRALVEVGAINLGQQRFGKDRPSLWAIRRQHLWQAATNIARKAEFESKGDGIFALLEEAGIEVADLRTSPEAVNLVRGFEELFGFPAPVD